MTKFKATKFFKISFWVKSQRNVNSNFFARKNQTLDTVCEWLWPLSQFYQRFMHALFVPKCFAQLFSSYVLAKKALLYKKRACKMLMKFTPLIASARAILKGSRTIHGAKISAWGHGCQPKQVFKDRALFFLNFCMWRIKFTNETC